MSFSIKINGVKSIRHETALLTIAIVLMKIFIAVDIQGKK